MTEQLTSNAIDALIATLRSGDVAPTPKPIVSRPAAKPKRSSVTVADTGADIAERIKRIQAMKFRTAGVKTAMLRTLKARQAIDAWHAVHPGSITGLLAMFGVRLKDVQPWAGSRWECLANGIGRNATLRLTYQPAIPRRTEFEAPLWRTRSVYEPAN